jgi:Raf kinase inhibitor-like YbhB/YbcL family protein
MSPESLVRGARVLASGCAIAVLVAGASSASVTAASDPSMTLDSPTFAAGAHIPRRHGCEGKDVPPALHWSGVPKDAKSLALIVDDPDAPDPAAPQTRWVHWIVYDLPPRTSGLAEGAAWLPSGARVGRNDWQRASWNGPCPPVGRHRYVFALYALDASLGDLHEPTRSQIVAAMKGHVLAEAQLIGTYQKGD